MKFVKEEVLVKAGNFPNSESYKEIRRQIIEAISKVVWPPGSSNFTIYPKKDANGVVPIKDAFLEHLVEYSWKLESKVDLGVTTRSPGPLDATCDADNKVFAVEWETGNISSSHRALNKLSIGIMKGILIGGALVLPTRDLYYYLTDRIGNYKELEPYFYLYKRLPCKEGILSVFAVEHDAMSLDVTPIRKGTDGRALG